MDLWEEDVTGKILDPFILTSSFMLYLSLQMLNYVMH